MLRRWFSKARANPPKDLPVLFHRYLETAPIGIVAVDADGQIAVANPRFAALTATDPTALVGRNIAAFVTPAGAEQLKNAMQRTTGADGVFELGLVRPDSELPCEISIGRLSAAEGGGFVLHFTDISGRKDLERQFVQSQKMQAVGQLAGGIAHDFNNLLTAIIGYTDLLMQRHAAGDPSFADIYQISQNAKRAASLVRQLLAFSRQQKLNPKVLQLTDTLAELKHLLKRLLGETITLDVIQTRDLWTVKGDETQLEQVIMNLAVNARDAMPDGGTLTLATSNSTITEQRQITADAVMPAGDYVHITVRDTGTGIPEAILERIFDPFFSTKDVGAGTGLGLATVYGIIKQTGGFITVDSRLGEGTTFHIYLPRHDLQPDDSVAEKPREQTGDLTGSGTILLVEDEDPVRLFGARALRNKGYEVVEARTGEAAVDIFRQDPQRFDLMITDVMMPVLDGPTLIRIVREIRPELRVVCISGYAEESMRQKLDSQTNIAFLPKPFTLKQLAGTVKKVMENT